MGDITGKLVPTRRLDALFPFSRILPSFFLFLLTAALCTAWVLGIGLPYWWALLIPALANLGWAFITARLIPDPYDMGIITPEVKIRQEKMEAKRKEMAEMGETMAADDGPAPISYRAALGIPMVAQYAFAFGFFKLTNYVLFFWLPYFLGKSFDPVTANLIAALYSVGMMPGGIIVGVVSDLFGGRRASVIGTFMCSLIVFLAVFSVYSESLSPGVLLFMLACMGILVGGYVTNDNDDSLYICDIYIYHVYFSHKHCSSRSQPQQYHHLCRCRGLGLPPVGPRKQQVSWYRDRTH
jgi:sugar phosphate permease